MRNRAAKNSKSAKIHIARLLTMSFRQKSFLNFGDLDFQTEWTFRNEDK